MKKCVITAIGKDKVGLIAKITAYFEKTQINVLDINQTIVGWIWKYDDDCGCNKSKERYYSDSKGSETAG